MQSIDFNIILDIQKLYCGYGGQPIVENFNLQVASGECIAICGPNGVGKSTLLRAIYQLCTINSGKIFYRDKLLNGKTPEEVKKLGIAYFMQKNAVFSKLSVKENLMLASASMRHSLGKMKMEEIWTLFPDLSKWQNKTTGLLSGGQRQQLATAMLLSHDADLWLLDEFTTGLDSEKSESFTELILRYSRMNTDSPKTVILVEHKPHIIKQLATRIINL
jgi:branched-chain amino acid transport system ATP-binding protein